MKDADMLVQKGVPDMGRSLEVRVGKVYTAKGLSWETQEWWGMRNG